MFKITHLIKNVTRLSEQVIRNQSQKLTINFKNVPNTNFITSTFYCTKSGNEIYFEKLNKNVRIEEVTKGDPEMEKKLCVAILETDVLKQEGAKVPDISFLKTQHWIELLSKQSISARKKYLTFLFKVEKKRENEQLKKEKRKEELANRPEYEDDGHLRYGLNHNTFLLRVYDSTINHLYNHNLMNAMMYGQKLVVDCGYDEHMITREHNNCAKQLMYVFSENRLHNQPFNLHFCNANPEAPTVKALHKHIATMYEPWFPLNIHEKSYLDLFPKQNLVYLTPHCREELLEYDHDAIYIIGAIVDKVNCEPLSLAKAKKEGLKMRKLPLDRYLQWGSGSGKSLTLNCVLNILLDISTTNDWKYALRHIPKRKVAEMDFSKPSKMFKRAPKNYKSGSVTQELLTGKFSLGYDPDEDEDRNKKKIILGQNKFENRNERIVRDKGFVKKLLKDRT